MNRRASLTQRVVWALTGTVAVFVSALAVLSYLTFDQMEDDLVNDILNNETRRLQQRIAGNAGDVPRYQLADTGPAMRAWAGRPSAAQGDEVDGFPEPLRGLGPGLHMLEPDQETWHVTVTDTPQGRLYVLYDATDNEARVHAFGLFVLGVGAICILAAYAMSRRVAAVAVGPLLEVARRLSNWAPDEPGQPAAARNDEAGQLMEAFNRVQGQVERYIAREREFAANLSHEVRTPLAAIRTDSEMMSLAPGLEDGTLMRLSRIAQNVDVIADTLQSARAMASERPGDAQRVNLASCMEDAWRGMEDAAAAAGLSMHNDIPRSAYRELDRYALLIVLRNLVRNAIEHAAPATLRATLLEDGTLVLRDNGRGIPAAKLPFVFQRYYSGRLRDAGGAQADDMPRGLGLAIAKRVCDMHGWTLDVTSAVEGPVRGTCFTVRFC